MPRQSSLMNRLLAWMGTADRNPRKAREVSPNVAKARRDGRCHRPTIHSQVHAAPRPTAAAAIGTRTMK